MTLVLNMSEQLESQVRQRAAALGKDPAAFILEAVEEKIKSDDRDWLSKISGKAGELFETSGMTEDELSEELERVKHDHRAAKRRQAG